MSLLGRQRNTEERGYVSFPSFDFTLSESLLTLGLLRNEVNGLLERKSSRNGGMGGGSVYPGIISSRDFNKARFALNNTEPHDDFH